MRSTNPNSIRYFQTIYIEFKTFQNQQIEGIEIMTENKPANSQVLEETKFYKVETGKNFEFPRRYCTFCGRPTKHSTNGRVCLICGSRNKEAR